MKLCRDRTALTTCGTTVSSYPRCRETRSHALILQIRFCRSSSFTLRWAIRSSRKAALRSPPRVEGNSVTSAHDWLTTYPDCNRAEPNRRVCATRAMAPGPLEPLSERGERRCDPAVLQEQSATLPASRHPAHVERQHRFGHVLLYGGGSDAGTHGRRNLSAGYSFCTCRNKPRNRRYSALVSGLFAVALRIELRASSRFRGLRWAALPNISASRA